MTYDKQYFALIILHETHGKLTLDEILAAAPEKLDPRKEMSKMLREWAYRALNAKG